MNCYLCIWSITRSRTPHSIKFKDVAIAACFTVKYIKNGTPLRLLLFWCLRLSHIAQNPFHFFHRKLKIPILVCVSLRPHLVAILGIFGTKINLPLFDYFWRKKFNCCLLYCQIHIKGKFLTNFLRNENKEPLFGASSMMSLSMQK